MKDFVADTVLKRDLFSQTRIGHHADDPKTRIVHRLVSCVPIWTRPIAWHLARREIRALGAVKGLAGVPQLIASDSDGLYRSWTDGTPLHLARPDTARWYRDAHRLLKAMRRRGVTHNDLAKPQNWLVAPDGGAAVIDFQLAALHRRHSRLARLMAYEDLRHLLKQKRSFAPHLLTPIEKRVLARKSWPSRLWMATGKRVYNFVTRRFLNWSDGEGTGDRIDLEGPAIEQALKALDGVTDSALVTYARVGRSVGLYVFAETKLPEEQLAIALADHRPDHIQAVPALPRDARGQVQIALLELVGRNQTSEIERAIDADPSLAPILDPIVAGRKNLTDRRLTSAEP